MATLDGDVFRRLAAARDFLAAHHAEPLVLADAARRAGISPYHFLRLFARAFDVTPHVFLQRVRLERARTLLARSDARVTDVCLEVGYSSLGSFSTLFARVTGLSPVAYRRRVRTLVPVPAQLWRLAIPCCFIAFYGGDEESNLREAVRRAGMVPLVGKEAS
jgi:AraC-like DNA-binding protein